MKRNLCLIYFSLLVSLSLQAETYNSVDVTPAQNNPTPTSPAASSTSTAPVKKEEEPIAQEFSTDYSYVGTEGMKQGNADQGKLDENSGLVHYVISPEISDGVLLRVGAEAERYSFGYDSNMALPNTLQAVSAVIGADIQASDDILLRVETQPGIYSDFTDVRTSSINAPLIVGGSYLVNKDLQWFFGLSMNVNRQYPVLPGAGVRWHYADDWTLDLLLPKPRLEYTLTQSLTLYGGMNLMGNTFQVSQDFGDTHGRTNLNNTVVDYTEIRVGPGLTWKFMPNLSLEIETGAVVFRDFDYYRAHTDVRSDGFTPYGQIALSGNF